MLTYGMIRGTEQTAMIKHEYDFPVIEKDRHIEKITPGQDIIMTGFIALEGTARLAKEQRERLLETLPEELLDDAENFLNYLSRVPEAAVAIKHGATAVLNVGDGGIMTALWHLAEYSGTGMRVGLRDIPVKQETIEICEVLEINPYHLLSGGCELLTADNGYRLCSDLKELGFDAAVIGHITSDNDKAIINGEGTGFLNRPQMDEYIRFHRQRAELTF